MASTITAGTTTGTALNFAGDTSGILTVQGVPIGSTTGLGAGNASIMKNRIINGAMVIDQRNAGASVTATAGIYTLDRWVAASPVASKFTVQQNAGSVTPPTGFVNYLGITSSSAYTVGASESFNFQQRIEGYNVADLGWGTASAKTVTLSFWVRSSLTGTFGGSVRNGAVDRSYPFSYTISVANTWEQKSITITGDTTGTWLTTNGIGLWLTFSIGTGSTLSGTAGSWAGANYTSATGATSVVGTSGATFYITGVQLEVGSSATGFEYRLYNQELLACRRYTRVQSFVITANTAPAALGYIIDMRTTPTITGGGAGFSSGGTSADLLAISQTTASIASLTLNAEL